MIGMLPCLIPAQVRAEEPLLLPRLTGEIQFDGLSDEPAWQGIAPLPVSMREPAFQAAPSEHTEIRLAYDEAYFYVAARCYDSEPAQIQITSLERDGVNLPNDAVYFILDTFNDKENALAFGVNPAGVRSDFVVFNDAQGDMPADETWNTFWDAAVARSDSGWFAEVRLPFSSLRFREEDGQVRMGFIIMRHIPRKNEWITFPVIPTKWGFWGLLKPSIAKEIVFEGIHSHTPVYLTPYALNGLGQSFALNQLKTGYHRVDDPTADLGADLKYSPTSNLTLDLTLNTDFAQVEADEQQVNLTRFSLFFPEKRLFFQERSSIFTFATGQNDRLFYSRRIGLTEDGEPTRIFGGARAVVRVGSWDVGFLDMQTAAQGTQPSENFGVLRLRRQVFNPNSYLGGMATSRLGRDGTYNLAYGLDGVIRCFGDDYLSYNYAQTAGNGQNLGTGIGLGRVQWERRAIEGLGYALGATYVGPDYDPGVGFVTRTDYTGVEGRLAYGWSAGGTSPLLRHGVSLSGFATRRNQDGAIESAELLPQWNLETKAGGSGYLRLRLSREDLSEPFSLSDQAEVPVGRYAFSSVEAHYGTSWNAPLHTGLDLKAGTFYDGWQWSWEVSPEWNASKHLSLGGSYQFSRVEFSDRGQRFAVHLPGVKAKVMLTTRFSASTFVQYASTADQVVANLRCRYTLREGNDLYLVYNEVLGVDRVVAVPMPPLSQSRAVLAKYSYTFQLSGPARPH
jgi:hypothetical protein